MSTYTSFSSSGLDSFWRQWTAAYSRIRMGRSMSTHTRLSLQGRWYVGAVIAAGGAAICVSLYDLAAGRIGVGWFLLAGLTLLSASMTVKVPTVSATISISETFVFTSLLVFGPSASALTVALDGLVASLWIHRRKKYEIYKTFFNVTAPALAIWVSAHVCFGLAGIEPLVHRSTPIQQLLPPLFLLATLYFFLNSWLMTAAISIESRVSPGSVWTNNFLWMSINYFGGASVSVLLVLLFEKTVVGSVALGIVIPLLTVFYLTFKIAMGRAEDTINHLTEIKQAAEERVRLEDQLREAQKMESVGRLAAGVAHDFNNLLTPMLGYAEMLLDETPINGRHREELQEIKQAAERARDLTRQLLAFGRKQILSLKPVDLRSVIVGFEKLLRRTVREDIRIDVRLPHTLGMTRADAGQIEQVLMNLAVNAQDAMPEGGLLQLELADVVVGDTHPGAPAEPLPGSYITLVVRDSGCGMDHTTLDRICEPFYTTKEHGKGTGLGLSTVYGIVKQHGGHLRIDSSPGQGSTFTVFLPRMEMPADSTQPDYSPVRMAPRGRENILVVEDNDAVRKMACQVLQRQGYQVIAAESGQACLDLVNATQARVDLLLSDIVMAGMNGRNVYERLAVIRPEVRVIYMSGYADEVVTHRGILDEGIQFIQKPFTPQALAQKVRHVLDAPR